jgi:hypothetical protein
MRTLIERVGGVLATMIAVALLSGAAFAEKRVALVIGNDRYVNLPTLQKAVNDADAVGEMLSKLGFEVVRGRNLGRQGMIDKLAEFTTRLEPGDTAVYFYAGHGVAIGNVNYLVPTDAPAADLEARVRGASIAEPDVVAEIQAKGARVAVLVLDACRDNPFPRQGTRSVGNSRGLVSASPARGVFVLYSAGAGQTALDRLARNDPDRNSVFTRVFIEQLAKPGLHLGDLAVEVREKVAAIALKATNDRGEAVPHEQTPAYYDQTIGGRVFLNMRSVAVEPAPSTTRPHMDPEAVVRGDYAFAERLNTRAAWDAFLEKYPTGFYADLARGQRDKLSAVEPRPQAPTPVRPPVATTPAPLSGADDIAKRIDAMVGSVPELLPPAFAPAPGRSGSAPAPTQPQRPMQDDVAKKIDSMVGPIPSIGPPVFPKR